MSQYLIPNHVYFCRDADAVVFLDLRKDEYSVIRGDPACTFLQTVSRISELYPATKLYESTVAEPNAKVISDLIEAELIAKSGSDVKPAIATRVERAVASVLDPNQSTSAVRVTGQDIRRFVASCTVAAFRLRFQSIETTVRSVERRHAANSDRPSEDWVKIRRLVAVFDRLRCLFPRDYLCLFDSLALVEFLARYDIFPTWVFGVRLDPWSAHCWVQHRNALLNEGIEEVEDYTPILAI